VALRKNRRVSEWVWRASGHSGQDAVQGCLHANHMALHYLQPTAVSGTERIGRGMRTHEVLALKTIQSTVGPTIKAGHSDHSEKDLLDTRGRASLNIFLLWLFENARCAVDLASTTWRLGPGRGGTVSGSLCWQSGS
jgi:hypothetical protein